MRSANLHRYTIEYFIRDIKGIMDTAQDWPVITSGIESLLERFMEFASFAPDEDSENSAGSRFSNIEHVRHIMNNGRNRAAIIGKVEPFLKTVRKRRYLGSSRLCAVCESGVREFLPYGELKPNRRCPVCGSLERDRLVWLFMHQETNLFSPPKKRMLHIAPEPCLASILRDTPNIDYVSVDLTKYAMIQADLTQLCFSDEIFDAVYASQVLEHILDDRRAMREIYRTLKVGGWAILQVPLRKGKATYEDTAIVDPDKREQAFGQRDHVRVYGEDYYDRLRDSGFTIQREKLLLQAIPSAAQRLGLMSNEEISFCIKNP